jgi:glycosyltransferase involved in cell wall biosynthesis
VKVIHVPFCFRPDPIGGTEIYVERLAREQQRRGVDVVVAAPASETSRYMDAGLSVRRFAVSGVSHLSSLYGDGDDIARREFNCIVDQERPDVVHLHAFTRAVSARLADDVRRRGVRLVFTYHTPTVSCQRGTLLRWGRTICDGKLTVHTCAGCALHGLGVGRKTSSLLGAVPTGVGRIAGGLGLAGGPWTGLRMTELVRNQHDAFRTFMNAVDRIVVLCDWAGALLELNSIPVEKLVLSRHGLPQSAALLSDLPRTRRQHVPLRVVFLGRLHPTKGVDTLLRAIAALPGVRLDLDVYGVAEDGTDSSYVRSLRALAANDPRVRWCAPVPSEQVLSVLRGYDVVAVPSRWLETGPQVVLEAFAAGVPVVGSRLGGLVELVDDRVDGLLVDPDSVAAWAKTLRELVEHPAVLQRLSAGVRPPRGMDAVVDDMENVYRALVPQP